MQRHQMMNYKIADKTNWFIGKMKSEWFSRQEIMKLAADEFPEVPWKTIEGTIGQYWSDSVNPNWQTHKTIQMRGLKVLELGDRRRLVDERERSTSVILKGGISSRGTASQKSDRFETHARKPSDDHGLKTSTRSEFPECAARKIWKSLDHDHWKLALERYWEFVKPVNLLLEKEFGQLDADAVSMMGAQEWYRFLRDKYFRWKYTARNRYGSTTKLLRRYELNDELHSLLRIKDRIFASDKNDIRQCLTLANSIHGLGTAGASGLLAVLFPKDFGTVDQFAVKALAQIPELQESDLIGLMKPQSLNLDDGVVLIKIMRRKADELNKTFSTSDWTPRKVDMVLWTCAR